MKFWNRFRRAELCDEMRAHREMLEEQFVREGMSRQDAAAAACRRFGNDVGTLEQSGDEWGFGWIGALLRDFRFAVRIMRGQPTLTATAALLAGLGLGANTAIVSVIQTVMLKPLGLRSTDKVVVASVRINKINLDHAETSGAEYRDLRSMTDVFDSVAAMEGHWWTFHSGGEPIRLRGRAVTADFFNVFLERPGLGRFITPEDRDTLVLSWQFWKSQFGGDRGVIGRTVMLDDLPYRIVGVAEETFRFPAQVDAWSSLNLSPNRLASRGNNMTLTLLGRLKNKVSLPAAAERVNGYVAAFKSTAQGREMADYGYFIDLESFGRYIAGDLRRPLILLWTAALTVLFTACANIAVLLLSRTAGRRREIAIRLSLGATRFQIVRQLAVEGLFLSLLGGVFGIVISEAAISFISRITLPGRQALALATIDSRLMLYGMMLSLASTLFFGLAPAIQLLRSSQTTAMTRGTRYRFQDVFITAQIATALVLLIATGLLLRSLWKIERIQPGFDPAGLTTALIIKSGSDATLLARLETRLRTIPGVEASALAYPLPFLEGGGLTSGFVIKGREQPVGGIAWHGEAWFVSPDYFRTLRIPLLRGRVFASSDTMSAAHVCVIDRKFADRFFPGEDPIGHDIGMYGPARIVGIVEDVRSSTLEHDSRASVYYASAQQRGFTSQGIIVRSAIPGVPIIRNAVRQTNGTVPVFDTQTMQDRIDESLGIRRIVATLVCVFAGICILLASVGLHGVVTQVVGERSGEIAVRMALGARPGQILQQFLQHGLRSGLTGITIGIALSVYAQKWLGNLLFGIKPLDPATFGEACVGILVVLLTAVFWPAMRASRVQPQTILRHE